MIVTRREAIRKGMSVFFIKPCRHGHSKGRYTSNSKCIKCIEINKKYKAELQDEYELYTSIYNKDENRTGIFRSIMLPHIKKARGDFALLVSRIKKDIKMNDFSRLGYSAQELKNHIETKFKDGMSWDNHGDWEFDHILPIYSFTLYDSSISYTPNTFSLLANKLDNIQPLWGKDNRKKSYKF